jgi:hypothetical protein
MEQFFFTNRVSNYSHFELSSHGLGRSCHILLIRQVTTNLSPQKTHSMRGQNAGHGQARKYFVCETMKEGIPCVVQPISKLS